MFSIILAWSWGILTGETARDERLVSGTKDDELEASAALSLISGLEVLEAGSSLAAWNKIYKHNKLDTNPVKY